MPKDRITLKTVLAVLGEWIVLCALIVAALSMTRCGSDTPVAIAPPDGVPVANPQCVMLRVSVRLQLGQREVLRWSVPDEPLLSATPLNTLGNPMPSECGWNGSARFDLRTPGMQCGLLGDSAGSSRYIKCERPGKGNIVGRVLVDGVEYSGDVDVEVI